MKKIPLFKVHIPIEQAMLNVREVLESGFINEGVQVTELTNQMKLELGSENLVLTNSCTSALSLALHLAGVKPGDEVITTAMTCVASNTPIETMGAKLVWADIDPRTGMLTPQTVEAKLTSLTRAVMVVAWAGSPPDLNGLLDLCEQRGIKLILDAAHAFGATYQQRPISEFAHFTCYSFQAIKHVTSGDGGALICRDAIDYTRSKALKWFGLDRDKSKDEKGNWKGQQWDVDIEEAGWKFNMNNVSAAIGLAQIPYTDFILGSHRCNAARYDELFQDCPNVNPVDQEWGAESSYWVYTVTLHDTAISRDELLKKLNDEGIMAGVVHVPNDMYTCFEKYATELPGTRDFSSRQFSLPCGWWMDENDVRYVAQRVKELTR